MTEWVEVGSLVDLRRRKKTLVQVAGTDVVLFAHEDRVHALADLCVHKQKRLSKGLIFKGKAICPGHQWAFDLETGWTDEWSVCQPTFAVRIEGDAVFVDPTPRVLAKKQAGG
ncbi:MAG TPA: Rieske 2Fe-2S domain-containing protein [Sphingomonas sp.]